LSRGGSGLTGGALTSPSKAVALPAGSADSAGCGAIRRAGGLVGLSLLGLRSTFVLSRLSVQVGCLGPLGSFRLRRAPLHLPAVIDGAVGVFRGLLDGFVIRLWGSDLVHGLEWMEYGQKVNYPDCAEPIAAAGCGMGQPVIGWLVTARQRKLPRAD
jgi:hypothetical protein